MGKKDDKKPAKKDDKKPAKKDDKKPAAAAGTITNDNWTWWKKGTAVNKVTIADNGCMRSPAIQMLLNNWIFRNSKPEFSTFKVLFTGLAASYKVLSNKKAIAKWKSFSGKLFAKAGGKAKGSVKGKGGIKIGLKVKGGAKAKAGAKAKGGLKLKVGAKGKAGVKAKGGAKGKGSVNAILAGKTGAKGKAKVSVKGKAKVGGKAKAKKSLVGEIQLGDGTGSLADPNKKKRRMQAAAPATPAAVNVSSNGVGVADVRTDLSSADSGFEGEGQGELASNLLKVFSSLAFALLVYFN